jgi:DNA-binding LacI/PurR family transcriptional regulator
MDGTLVDTEGAWTRARDDVARERSADWSACDSELLVGTSLPDSARGLAQRGVRLPENVIEQQLMGRVAAELEETVPWRPGARGLLADLVRAQARCALVTMAYREVATKVVAAVPGCFEVIVAGDEVLCSKPDSACYLRSGGGGGRRSGRIGRTRDKILSNPLTCGGCHMQDLPMGNRFPTTSKRATIADVAVLAGVSKGTVSKFLGDGDYYIADATRTRIADAVAELDFQPNAIARGLVRRRTQTIGVIVASVVNPLYPDLITGIDEVLGSSDYTLIFASTEGSAAKEAAVVRSMQQRQVDGIVMASVTLRDGEVSQLVESGLDVVLASRHLKRSDLVDAVVIDNEDGARQAVEHLVAHGHQRIAHVAGPQDVYPFEIRRDTYERVLTQAGLSSSGLLAQAGSTGQEAGAAAIEQLLDMPDRPTAVFVASDGLAIGVIEACAARGVRIPDDLAIVGFDNIWVGAMHGVQLTTVDSRARDIGREAAQRLVDRIENRWSGHTTEAAPELRVLPTRLVRRRTCGCGAESSDDAQRPS